ncbi:protein arginine N-methyltransferase 1-B-like isoform X2 [Mytilus galloprovincialis]
MDECDQKYFGSYSKLNIHEVMLRDEVRTGTYRNAILQNTNLFRDKVVLDVGCGTGILCMFAAEAGASKVIGIDCAQIIDHTRDIVSKNGFSDVITLIKCKVEDAKLPDGIDKVDIIISETMGYCLLFESSIHSILFARDKWLKKEGGLIFPDKFWLYLTAFEDKRFRDKISYWDNVQGYDMSSIIQHQDFDSMYVDVIDASKVVSNSSLIKEINLYTVKEKELSLEAPYHIQINKTGVVDGFLTYFDIGFSHCVRRTGFSTAPEAKPTHWKQTVIPLWNSSISVTKGDSLYGTISIKPHAYNRRGLDVKINISRDTDSGLLLEKDFSFLP